MLLRGAGDDLEVLAGRHPRHAKFMPGTEALGPKLARSARAALCEIWEEARVLIGRPAGSPPTSAALPIEQAYRIAGWSRRIDVLTYVGRAITPSHSARRFNTRFSLGDGGDVIGQPMASEELEDVGGHPIGREALASFRDVTRFMLARRSRRARGPRPARHRFSIGPRTPAASAFAARRSVQPRRPQRASTPSALAPHRLPGIHQSWGSTADFRLGTFRSLVDATRRAAARAARAHTTSSSGSSNSRSGARQKERSIVLPFFS
jgi:hypothetical protein